MSADCIQRQLLITLPHIGSTICELLYQSGIAFKDIYEGCSADLIASVGMSGYYIGIKKAEKIIKNSTILKSNGAISKKIQADILSVIPGISTASAKYILSNLHFVDILSMSVVDIANIQKSAKGKKLGIPIAEKINMFLIKKNI